VDGRNRKILGLESWTYFLAMNQKIPTEILNRKEHSIEPPADNHVITGKFGSLVKNARFSECLGFGLQ
jgi:hypothetical protein